MPSVPKLKKAGMSLTEKIQVEICLLQCTDYNAMGREFKDNESIASAN